MTLTYCGHTLCIAGRPIPSLAEKQATPFYAYSLPNVQERARAFRRAFPGALVAFALKANRYPPLLRALAAEGLGADVVSLGEWHLARAAGFPPERVVVNGNAKSDALLQEAIAAGVQSINLDAAEEVPRVAAAARAVGKTAAVAIRINPGLDVHTHPHLQVAAKGSHFGVPPGQVLAVAQAITEAPELRLVGIHLHPGSQLLAATDWEAVVAAAREWVGRLRGAGFPVQQVNFGGGLGITYTDAADPQPAALAEQIHRGLERLKPLRLAFEPGRWLVARAGVLVVRVVQVKQAWGQRFVAVDGGMNALLRPALYGAHHRIWPVQRREPTHLATVVGPNCESTDVLARDVPLPADLTAGDLLAVLDTGAYGASMANTYNARPLPAEMLVGESLPPADV